MFVKKGVAATSVEDIAETAVYTRGAFYSNVHGKPELLLELVRRDDDSAHLDLRDIFARSRMTGMADDPSDGREKEWSLHP